MIKDCNRKFFAYGKFNYPRIKQRGGKQIKGDFFMKMTKKIFLAAIAVAAFAFTGCADLLGKVGTGTTTGTKWNKTMTVDGTKKDLYKEDGTAAYAYRRFIKKIKVKESVTNIATEITIDPEKSTIHTDNAVIGGGNAVVGLAFDFHTDATTKKYDFVLVGFAPYTKKFYIERYYDIEPENAKDADKEMDETAEDLGDQGFDSSAGAMGSYIDFDKGTDGILRISSKTTNKDDDWVDLPAGAYDETTGKLNVEIKQETAGLYEVYLGGKKVAEYPGTVKIEKEGDDYNGFAQGGVAVYANTPVGKTYDATEKKGSGTKVVVKYASDKDKTHGLFEEDAE